MLHWVVLLAKLDLVTAGTVFQWLELSRVEVSELGRLSWPTVVSVAQLHH